MTSPKAKALDCNQEKPVSKVKPLKVAKRVGVTTIAKKLLEQNKTDEQKFHGVMKIITDPNFLVGCYEEIKSKPGNMTRRGVDGSTLDGINYA